LRVIFMGTPDFAVPTLTEIIAQGHEVVAVYTRAPKAAGRGLALQESPVHKAALRFGAPVLTPRSLKNEDEHAQFAALKADVAVVVAYGLILPKPVLEAPVFGCLNLHGSLLPRWRGAAPLQRAIMAGDAETGVMVMRMEEGLDTGPVGMAEKIAITPDMTAQVLHDRLMVLGADLMARALAALQRGSLSFRAQSLEGVVYASKITKEEARIDWSLPAATVRNHIHGLSPFPGAWFEADWGQGPVRIKVLRCAALEQNAPPGTCHALEPAPVIGCGTGSLRLDDVQRAGKEAMPASIFLRGLPKLAPGQFRIL
jgi:methionyl-tRNA formyltransferase